MTADSDSTPTKACSKCGGCKPARDFYKMASARDGLQYVCKLCQNASKKQKSADGPVSAALKDRAELLDKIDGTLADTYAEKTGKADGKDANESP